MSRAQGDALDESEWIVRTVEHLSFEPRTRQQVAGTIAHVTAAACG